MNKKLQIRNVFIVIFVSSVLMVSQACEADICSRVEKQKSFSDIDSIENGFFEKYYVRKSGDVYYIYAEKSTQLDYIAATEVMKKLESYPQFMPGYKAISVRREMNKEIVADIQFRPWFSFFRSRFSNQLEIVVGLKNYKQCWEQLDSTDERVNGKYNFEPKKNKGYWHLINKNNGGTDFQYFSVIQPPVDIPSWLYKWIVENSYEDAFRKVMARIQSDKR